MLSSLSFGLNREEGRERDEKQSTDANVSTGLEDCGVSVVSMLCLVTPDVDSSSFSLQTQHLIVFCTVLHTLLEAVPVVHHRLVQNLENS